MKKRKSRILYGSKPPESFIEEADFDIENPYSIRVKAFETDDLAPPHYSKDTLEILLCENVRGEVSIFKKRCTLDSANRYAFVMPPGVVHSTFFFAGSGVVHILQVSLPDIEQLMNFNNILDIQGYHIDDLLYSAPTYDELFPLIKSIIDNDGNFFECLRCLLSIMELLCNSFQYNELSFPKNSTQSSSELKKVISWTNENYASSITVNDIAHMIGMSNSYFCSWFKSKTDLTYVQYLNQVRIYYAARLLSLGETTSSVAFACGFQNVSYFIQVFKKIKGCTPKEYKQKFSITL